MNVYLNVELDGSIAPDYRAHVDLSGLASYLMPIVELCRSRSDHPDEFNLNFIDRWTSWEQRDDYERWQEVEVHDSCLTTTIDGARVQAVLQEGAGHEKSRLRTESLDYGDLAECLLLDKELRRYRLERIRAAIEGGATWMANGVNDEGQSLLHEAIYLRDEDMVEWLVTAGADVNAPDANGRAPIVLAVNYQLEHAVRLLIAGGAALPEGILDYGRRRSRVIFDMLIEAGGSEIDPEFVDEWDVAPVCPFCEQHYVQGWIDEYLNRWEYTWIDDQPCDHLVGWFDLLEHPDGDSCCWSSEDIHRVFVELGWGEDEGVAEIEWTFGHGCCGPGYNGPGNIFDLGDGTHTGSLYFASDPDAILERARSLVALSSAR